MFLQGEMQQLRDKLAITERAAKSEAQLKVINLFLQPISNLFFLLLAILFWDAMLSKIPLAFNRKNIICDLKCLRRV